VVIKTNNQINFIKPRVNVERSSSWPQAFNWLREMWACSQIFFNLSHCLYFLTFARTCMLHRKYPYLNSNISLRNVLVTLSLCKLVRSRNIYYHYVFTHLFHCVIVSELFFKLIFASVSIGIIQLHSTYLETMASIQFCLFDYKTFEHYFVSLFLIRP